jgi:hypothetical protein
VVRVHDKTILVGSTDVFEIRVYGMDGHLRRLIRLERANSSVEPAHIRADQERLRSDGLRFRGLPATVRQRYEATVNEMPYPETFPAFSELLTDHAGGIWVRDYAPPGSPRVGWYVLDARGRLQALLEVPAEFSVYDARDDQVLVGRTDSLGVEYVEMRSVEK